MKAAALQAKKSNAELTSLQKVIGAFEEYGNNHVHLLSPVAAKCFADEVSGAKSLVAKMEATPGGQFLEESAKHKKSMLSCLSLLKSAVKAASRFGN